MKATDICSIHNKPLVMVCMGCKEIICLSCLPEHCKKKHDYPLNLSSYATEYILPSYSKMLEELEKQKSTIEASSKDFIIMLSKVIEGLIVLKGKLESLLIKISEAIDELGSFIGESRSTYNNIKENLIQNQKNLQEAINDENNKLIIESMKTPEAMQIFGIGDSDKSLVKAINSTVEQLTHSKEFDSLSEGINTLIKSCKKIAKPSYCSIPVVSKYVYGNANSPYKILYRYDIERRKIFAGIPIPEFAAVLQTGKQVFVCGGYGPNVNTLSEYIETTQTFAAKVPMNYARGLLKLLSISPSHFLAIAGQDNSEEVSYCEEYSINENIWNVLPSLKQNRHSPGVTLINNTDVYVIGGYNSKTIEKFNLKERKEWITVAINTNEITLNNSVASFAISPDEIMILAGNCSTDTGIYTLKTGTIKKHTSTTLGENYYWNSVNYIGGKIYTIGGQSGHVFIYYPSENKFEMLNFNNIKS